jgi:hypothetical protein
LPKVCKHFAITLFLFSFNLTNASSSNLITLWSILMSHNNIVFRQSFENVSWSIKGLLGCFDTQAFKTSLMAMHTWYTSGNVTHS